jgi:hypothetical protein
LICRLEVVATFAWTVFSTFEVLEKPLVDFCTVLQSYLSTSGMLLSSELHDVRSGTCRDNIIPRCVRHVQMRLKNVVGASSNGVPSTPPLGNIRRVFSTCLQKVRRNRKRSRIVRPPWSRTVDAEELRGSSMNYETVRATILQGFLGTCL